MPNEKLTEIVAIIDRSGSMFAIKDDMTGGFRSFIADQAKLPDPAVLSVYTFDDVVDEPFCEEASLDEAKKFELIPRGWTALLDAVGSTIVRVGERLAKKPDAERPGKVIVIVITDGAENKSKEYKRAQIAEMVKHQTDKYNWQFAFLGANIDSFAEASQLGISRASTMDYVATEQGTQTMYAALSRSVLTYRNAGSDASLSLQSTEDDDK